MEDFMGYETFKIRDGSQTKFWEDTKVGYKPLNEHFPRLYNAVKYRHISFRRALVGINLLPGIN
jgi:hypothetical protein